MNLIPPGIAGLLGLLKKEPAEPKTWESRIKEAAYTSPKTGTRIPFYWEELTRKIPLRRPLFEFQGIKDGYVQQNGFGPRMYPMRCFFTGKDCDLIATAFEGALLEDGIGTLEHPFYGTFKVVPVDEIVRRDDLSTAANETVVDVTFMTSVAAVYPSSRSAPKNEIEAALAGFDLAAALEFERKAQLPNALAKATLLGTIKKFLKDVNRGFNEVSDSITAANQEFRDLQDTLTFGLDVLIGQPLALAQQISDTLKAPGRALTAVTDRLDGYENIAARLFGSKAANPALSLEGGIVLASNLALISNDFAAADLFAANTVGGSIVSVLNNQFSTKPQALSAAARVLTQIEAFAAWREEGFTALEAGPLGEYQVDPGEAFQQLQQAAALTAGYLIEISFTLVPELAVVIDRDRTVVDLCGQLYGTVDRKLDFLIQTNNLIGDEILELPRGKKIVYYPEPKRAA